MARGDPTDPAALDAAIIRGDLARFRRMLAAGVDVNAGDALYHAAAHQAEMVQRLLAAGADVNPTRHASSPLHEAIRHRTELDGTRLLLDAGAAIDALDFDGRTPLMVACREGKPQHAELLLARAARVDVVGKAGDTALSLAMVWCSRAAERLVELGALGHPLRRPPPGSLLFIDECDVCALLDDHVDPDDKWTSAPATIAWLETVESANDVDGKLESSRTLYRCPCCATHYRHDFSYECETSGVTPPDVSESIDRLSPGETVRRLRELDRPDDAAAFAATVPGLLAHYAMVLADPSAAPPWRLVAHLRRALAEAAEASVRGPRPEVRGP